MSIPIFKNSTRLAVAMISILTFKSLFAMLADTLHLDYVREYIQPVLKCNITKIDRSGKCSCNNGKTEK